MFFPFSWPGWKLLGILLIIIGLRFRWRTGPVVLAAGILTGLVSGLPLIGENEHHPGILDLLGKSFVENRLITLYLITLPAVGLAERYGLHGQAAHLIHKLRSATVGRLLWTFQLLRVIIGTLGLRLNGHTVFGRPLILPMATGLSDSTNIQTEDKIKSGVGASENYGNFFGQNLFPASAGCLLVATILKDAGYPVNPVRLSLLAIPIVLVSLIYSAIQFGYLDRSLKPSPPTQDQVTSQKESEISDE